MPKVLNVHDLSKCIGCFTCMKVCAAVNHQSFSLHKSSIHIKTNGGLSGRFVASVCHACLEPACVEACPTGALTKRTGGGALLNSDRCIGCRQCVSACSAMAINFDEEKKEPIICHHCGLCARFCPHNCLRMVDAEVSK